MPAGQTLKHASVYLGDDPDLCPARTFPARDVAQALVRHIARLRTASVDSA